MIRNLQTAEPQVRLLADIGVVGGGTAGLVLATTLVRAGLRVVVLESGDATRSDFADQLNQVLFSDKEYQGATRGRVRGLGGTSAIWGGALLPFQREDFEARPEIHMPAWPVQYDGLGPYVGEVEKLFGVAGGSYDRLSHGQQPGDPPTSVDFAARYAKWPTFKRRNVGTLLRAELRSLPGLEIWLNATVTDFIVDRANGSVDSIIARSPSGNLATLDAKHFVFCAGPIESTRLLLWLATKANFAGRTGDPLGHFLHDHISAPLAEIRSGNSYKVNRIGGFSFERRTMRSFRYEFTSSARREDHIRGGFCHFTFNYPKNSGLDNLRTFMQSIQKGRPAYKSLLGIAKDLPYLAKMIDWRCRYSQLYWPPASDIYVNIVIEQAPAFSNAISLGNKCDHFGVPLASIAWRINEQDIATFRGIASRFDTFWRRSALSDAGELQWYRNPEDIEEVDLCQASDIFHPGGTTRMGSERSESVVDDHLTAWNVPNLSIASTSVFPTGGGANPTMTLLMFTLRLADELARRYASPAASAGTRYRVDADIDDLP